MGFDEQLGARIRVMLAGRNDMTERRMFGGPAGPGPTQALPGRNVE